jgi:dTDP-4-amino-4,6-dideoxygalactose transaminase
MISELDAREPARTARDGQVYLSAPDVGPLEEEYLLDALRSGWAAPAGPHLAAFEQEVAARVGRSSAVAVSSGTAALHLALLALGVGPDQVVVVPTLTFAATANAVAYTGAEPVFVDCYPSTGNIDVGLLADVLHRLRVRGQRVGAVIPVDVFGACADYTELLPVCEAYGVPVVEDAAEALGAAHGGRAAGSFGRAAAVSFNGNKIITTSGGGMLLSDDPALVERGRYLATQARQPVTHYEHTDIGYNYRLSNLLAAMGRAQLWRLDEMMARRRALRERYRDLFAPIPGVRVLAAHDRASNCWLTTIVVDPQSTRWTAGQLAAFLAQHQIETRPVWKPMHLQPVFSRARTALTGAAEELFASGLTLPSGSVLTEAQIDRVCLTVEHFLKGYS